MLRPRTLLVATLLWLAVHVAVWAFVARTEPTRYPWPADVRSVMEYWDAWHYSAIATEGYTGARWAFYPLYPLAVRVLARLTGLGARPDVVGVVFSTLCFSAFCLWQARLAGARGGATAEGRGPGPPGACGLAPETLWGWLFFLAWPASWVFHSHHTESLFLLLSFAAFVASRRGGWRSAAALAGLCALTRNQGVFVAAAVALEAALGERGWRRKALTFGASGALSFLLFACWPAYQYAATGDATSFLRSQTTFSPLVNSAYEFFGTIWFANPVQRPHQHLWTTQLHHLSFLVMNAAAAALLFRRQWPLALYALLSLWAPLYLGHLENAFRYGAVLFPVVFLLGDNLRRLPAPARWLTLAGLVLLNLTYMRYYALGEWAY